MRFRVLPSLYTFRKDFDVFRYKQGIIKSVSRAVRVARGLCSRREVTRENVARWDAGAPRTRVVGVVPSGWARAAGGAWSVT